MNEGEHHHDVVVVGARCAGAATALLLATAGHDVALVDRATFPSDTLSTHAITRDDGVVQLDRWGLLPAVVGAGAPPIREAVLHAGGTSLRRTVKDGYGVDFLIAPRRHALDALLVGAAVAAGARLATGVTVEDVVRAEDGRVTGVLGRSRTGRMSISARFVVGADGVHSRIARSVGAPVTEVRTAGSGAAHYAYYAGNWPALEYFISDRSFAGIFPTNDGEACIWVCSPADDAASVRRTQPSVDAALDTMVQAAAPELAERLASSATRTSRARGVIGLPNHLRHPVGPGWALVGDAGYHDPITGHGISDAFRDAELLAGALDAVLGGEAEESALAGYHAERDAQLREIFEITSELVTFPPPARFVELQKQLSRAIDTQAGALAARPRPALPAAA